MHRFVDPEIVRIDHELDLLKGRIKAMENQFPYKVERTVGPCGEMETRVSVFENGSLKELKKQFEEEMRESKDRGNDIRDPEPKFLKLAADKISDLVIQKNKAYGNSFHTSAKVLELLYPNGIEPYQYSDALFLVRIWDKMKRIATDKDALGESPYQDIMGYSLLAYEKQTYEDCLKSSEGPFDE